MGILSDELAGQLGASTCRVDLGVIGDISDDTGIITVTVNGVDLVGIQVITSYTPNVNDKVLLLRQKGFAWIVGSLDIARPVTGTVASVAAPLVTVTTSIGNLVLPYLASYAPAASDSAVILWQGNQGIVIGKQAVAPLPPSKVVKVVRPPAAPPRPHTSGQKIFPCSYSNSYRGGWRDDTDDVIQGTAPTYPGQNNGAWFYNGRPRATLAGATITAAWIYLRRLNAGAYAGQSVHIWRISNNSRPAGNATYVAGPYDFTLAVGQAGWFQLPTAVGQALVDSGGSLGIQGASPYLRMAGPRSDGQAGALRLNWRR